MPQTPSNTPETHTWPYRCGLLVLYQGAYIWPDCPRSKRPRTLAWFQKSSFYALGVTDRRINFLARFGEKQIDLITFVEVVLGGCLDCYIHNSLPKEFSLDWPLSLSSGSVDL
jgi:hypothetical protein